MPTGTNVKDWWKVVLEFSEQNVRFLMWWFFLPGLFLLSPIQVRDFLHLAWFYNYFGWLFGMAFLATGTLLFIDICYYIGFQVQIYLHLKYLTKDEKDILLGFVENSKQTQTLRINSGTVITLLEMKILRMASNITYNYGPFDTMGEYIICPWVFKYLINHPQLLEGGVAIEKGLPVD